MNKRIKELAERANVKPLYSPAYAPRYIFEEEELEKFAELIVQEMCSVLDKAQWDKGEDWICADGTRIIPQIKEHFGVEE